MSTSTFSILGYSLNFYGVFILCLLFMFFYLLYKAQKNQRLDWVDIITKDGRTVSLTKILQLIGGTVGTWVIVQTTLDGNLTWDIFAIYLTYVASIEGFSKFISAKYRPYGSSGGDGDVNYRARYNADYEGNVRQQKKNQPKRQVDLDDQSRLMGGAAKTPE